DLINKFKASILYLWRDSNLTCFQGGGGIETCGSIDAVNTMLLQSNFGELRVFPDWPKERDAYFKRLRAKGAFLVSSAQEHGKIPSVKIQSLVGGECHVVSPWPSETVTLYRNDRKAGEVSGEILKFPTKKSETIVLVPSGSKPANMKIAL